MRSNSRTAFALLASVSLTASPARAETNPVRQAVPAYTNRLVDASDPYLLEHAHNPVDWYPWGPAALAKAKAEDKPIFLSIGYSTCFWCHVAEKTIYSDPAIAALMNKWFVNIKVDREEHPEIDRLYIIATEMLTQHGAWPNNLFLTPGLKPFYAGSYFPPKDQPDGTPGFPKVLAALHDLWVNHRADKIDPAANELYDALKTIEQRQAEGGDGRGPTAIDPAAWMKQASDSFLARVDFVNGGFGSDGPKFPQAPALSLMLANAGRNPAARDALAGALDAIAYGGIHDQIGGGLHRYSAEPTWSVPHFEKMLSDNAQFLRLYAQAFALTKAPLDRFMAQDIAGYLEREMMAPKGGFYTAQDAEVNGHEGADYLWTRPRIEAALGAEETERFLALYDLVRLPGTPPPDSSDETAPPPSVLRLRLPIDATLKRTGFADVAAMLAAFAGDRDKLLAVRRTLPQPPRDDKIVTSLNGLAIGAFARAGLDLDRPDYIDVARQTAERIWAGAYDAEGDVLDHQIFADKASGDGVLEDYAMLGDGFLTLADATREGRWRIRADSLAETILRRFLQPNGRLKTTAGDDALPIALEDGEDGDVPSGTSATIALLTRLGAEPNGARFQVAAAKIVSHLAARIARSPQSWPSVIVALVDHPISPDALTDVKLAAPPQLATAESSPSAPRLTGVPATSDHVHAAAKVDGDTVAVTLTVDPGFHINAHKPSLDYLVPTDLSFAGPKPVSVAYPQATRFQSAFAKDGLDVYEGVVALVATFPKDVLSGMMALDAEVTAQACDKETCLPPSTFEVTAPNPGR